MSRSYPLGNFQKIAIRQCAFMGRAALVVLCASLQAQVPAPAPVTVASADQHFRKEYVITPGDHLDIVVRRVPEATRTVQVRADGRITLPLIDDVAVAGLTTGEVHSRLTSLLSRRLVNPEVTVIAAQSHEPTVYVAGEVAAPGALPLRNATSAVQAISIAGGLKRTAASRGIIIIRLGDDGALERLPIQISKSGQSAPFEMLAKTRLQPDDIIFVPENGRSQLNRFIDDFVNHPLQGVNGILGTYANFRLVQIFAKAVQ